MCSFCRKTDSQRNAKGSQNTDSIQFIRMWFKSIQFCWKKDKHNQYFSLYNFIKLRINILHKLRITEPFDIMFLPYYTFTHLTNNYWAFPIWQRLSQALGWIVNKTKSLPSWHLHYSEGIEGKLSNWFLKTVFSSMKINVNI